MSNEANEVLVFNPPVSWVKSKLEDAGNHIGSVHFEKRKDGALRKMSYRLHVKNPSVAAAPKGIRQESRTVCSCGKEKGNGLSQCNSGPFTTVARVAAVQKKDIDKKNNQMTVFDTNKVVRKDGVVIGRGAWRTVPLEKVVRIRSKGTTSNIKRGWEETSD